MHKKTDNYTDSLRENHEMSGGVLRSSLKNINHQKQTALRKIEFLIARVLNLMFSENIYSRWF